MIIDELREMPRSGGVGLQLFSLSLRAIASFSTCGTVHQDRPLLEPLLDECDRLGEQVEDDLTVHVHNVWKAQVVEALLAQLQVKPDR